MGLVQQEPVLLKEDIAYNISYGTPNASAETIVSAAKNANAYKFITELEQEEKGPSGEEGLPAQFRVSCGHKGSQLSVG